MKRKPFALKGLVLLYPCIFMCIVLVAACGNGGKKEPEKQSFGGGNGGKYENAGSPISREAAEAMINNYKLNKQQLMEGKFAQDTLVLPYSETFDRGIIDSLMSQPGVAGVRIYFCMDTTSSHKIKVILVATNRMGRDILNSGASREGTPPPPMVVEDGTREP